MCFVFQDSVICLEEGDGSSTVKSEDTKAKKQKKVRSLNDVLGKNTPGTKGTKTLAGNGTYSLDTRLHCIHFTHGYIVYTIHAATTLCLSAH